jgi:Firmicute plasmid replication protein (RepL)
MGKETKIKRISKVDKYEKNPFLGGDVLTIKRGKSSMIIGSTNKLLVDEKTGEVEGLAILHKYTEVDKDEFVKVYIKEMKNLLDLTSTGTKSFYFLLECLRINEATVYINITKMAEYCKWKNTSQCYLGLGELIANKVIAPSTEPNLWFINPNFIFNGNRIVFMKEYRRKEEKDIKKIPVQGVINIDI